MTRHVNYNLSLQLTLLASIYSNPLPNPFDLAKKQNTDQHMNFAHAPTDVFAYIISLVVRARVAEDGANPRTASLHTLYECMRVCKAWHTLIDNNEVVWRQLVNEHFQEW